MKPKISKLADHLDVDDGDDDEEEGDGDADDDDDKKYFSVFMSFVVFSARLSPEVLGCHGCRRHSGQSPNGQCYPNPQLCMGMMRAGSR